MAQAKHKKMELSISKSPLVHSEQFLTPNSRFASSGHPEQPPNTPVSIFATPLNEVTQEDRSKYLQPSEQATPGRCTPLADASANCCSSPTLLLGMYPTLNLSPQTVHNRNHGVLNGLAAELHTPKALPLACVQRSPEAHRYGPDSDSASPATPRFSGSPMDITTPTVDSSVCSFNPISSLDIALRLLTPQSITSKASLPESAQQLSSPPPALKQSSSIPSLNLNCIDLQGDEDEPSSPGASSPTDIEDAGSTTKQQQGKQTSDGQANVQKNQASPRAASRLRAERRVQRLQERQCLSPKRQQALCISPKSAKRTPSSPSHLGARHCPLKARSGSMLAMTVPVCPDAIDLLPEPVAEANPTSPKQPTTKQAHISDGSECLQASLQSLVLHASPPQRSGDESELGGDNIPDGSPMSVNSSVPTSSPDSSGAGEPFAGFPSVNPGGMNGLTFCASIAPGWGQEGAAYNANEHQLWGSAAAETALELDFRNLQVDSHILDTIEEHHASSQHAEHYDREDDFVVFEQDDRQGMDLDIEHAGNTDQPVENASFAAETFHNNQHCPQPDAYEQDAGPLVPTRKLTQTAINWQEHLHQHFGSSARSLSFTNAQPSGMSPLRTSGNFQDDFTPCGNKARVGTTYGKENSEPDILSLKLTDSALKETQQTANSLQPRQDLNTLPANHRLSFHPTSGNDFFQPRESLQSNNAAHGPRATSMFNSPLRRHTLAAVDAGTMDDSTTLSKSGRDIQTVVTPRRLSLQAQHPSSPSRQAFTLTSVKEQPLSKDQLAHTEARVHVPGSSLRAWGTLSSQKKQSAFAEQSPKPAANTQQQNAPATPRNRIALKTLQDARETLQANAISTQELLNVQINAAGQPSWSAAKSLGQATPSKPSNQPSESGKKSAAGLASQPAGSAKACPKVISNPARGKAPPAPGASPATPKSSHCISTKTKALPAVAGKDSSAVHKTQTKEDTPADSPTGDSAVLIASPPGESVKKPAMVPLLNLASVLKINSPSKLPLHPAEPVVQKEPPVKVDTFDRPAMSARNHPLKPSATTDTKPFLSSRNLPVTTPRGKCRGIGIPLPDASTTATPRRRTSTFKPPGDNKETPQKPRPGVKPATHQTAGSTSPASNYRTGSKPAAGSAATPRAPVLKPLQHQAATATTKLSNTSKAPAIASSGLVTPRRASANPGTIVKAPACTNSGVATPRAASVKPGTSGKGHAIASSGVTTPKTTRVDPSTTVKRPVGASLGMTTPRKTAVQPRAVASHQPVATTRPPTTPRNLGAKKQPASGIQTPAAAPVSHTKGQQQHRTGASHAADSNKHHSSPKQHVAVSPSRARAAPATTNTAPVQPPRGTQVKATGTSTALVATRSVARQQTAPSTNPSSKLSPSRTPVAHAPASAAARHHISTARTVTTGAICKQGPISSPLKPQAAGKPACKGVTAKSKLGNPTQPMSTNSVPATKAAGPGKSMTLQTGQVQNKLRSAVQVTSDSTQDSSPVPPAGYVDYDVATSPETRPVHEPHNNPLYQSQPMLPTKSKKGTLGTPRSNATKKRRPAVRPAQPNTTAASKQAASQAPTSSPETVAVTMAVTLLASMFIPQPSPSVAAPAPPPTNITTANHANIPSANTPITKKLNSHSTPQHNPVASSQNTKQQRMQTAKQPNATPAAKLKPTTAAKDTPRTTRVPPKCETTTHATEARGIDGTIKTPRGTVTRTATAPVSARPSAGRGATVQRGRGDKALVGRLIVEDTGAQVQTPRAAAADSPNVVPKKPSDWGVLWEGSELGTNISEDGLSSYHSLLKPARISDVSIANVAASPITPNLSRTSSLEWLNAMPAATPEVSVSTGEQDTSEQAPQDSGSTSSASASMLMRVSNEFMSFINLNTSNNTGPQTSLSLARQSTDTMDTAHTAGAGQLVLHQSGVPRSPASAWAADPLQGLAIVSRNRVWADSSLTPGKSSLNAEESRLMKSLMTSYSSGNFENFAKAVTRAESARRFSATPGLLALPGIPDPDS